MFLACAPVHVRVAVTIFDYVCACIVVYAVGPCGPLSDDLCAADVNAVNGSCTAVSPDSYR